MCPDFEHSDKELRTAYLYFRVGEKKGNCELVLASELGVVSLIMSAI